MAVEADGGAQVPAGALEAAADDAMRTDDEQIYYFFKHLQYDEDFFSLSSTRVTIIASQR